MLQTTVACGTRFRVGEAIILAAAILSGCGQREADTQLRQREAAILCDKARKCLKDNDTAKAESLFRQALEVDRLCDQAQNALTEMGKGRDPVNLAKHQIGLFATALGCYATSVGCFPTTRQGLQALRTRPPDLPKEKQWNGPYLTPEVWLQPLSLELPLDPWGHPFHYRSPGIHSPDSFDLWSVGPDGVDGTKDDIGNWK